MVEEGKPKYARGTWGGQPSHQWKGLKQTGRTDDDGVAIPGDPIIIKCHRSHLPPPCKDMKLCAKQQHMHTGICGDCLHDLGNILDDIPHLLEDLDAAIAGDVNFVERGTYAGLEADVDQIGGRNPAVLAQQRLVQAIMGDGTAAHPGFADWVDPRSPGWMASQLRSVLLLVQDEDRMPALAQDLSQAASRAHHVIEIPQDLVFYGPCPQCSRDLWQERVHKDDTDTDIVCQNRRVPNEDGEGFHRCDYKAKLDVHQKHILDLAADNLMTVAELVGSLEIGGEPVTRDQINGWIRRKRLLPRQLHKLKWNQEEGKVEQIPEVRYRLGDARVLAEEANERAKRKAKDRP